MKKTLKEKKTTLITNKTIKKKQPIPIKIVKTVPIAKITSTLDFKRLANTPKTSKGETILLGQTAAGQTFLKISKPQISFLTKFQIKKIKNKIENLSENQKKKLLWLLVGLVSFFIFIIWAINFKDFTLRQNKNTEKQNDFTQLKNELQNSYQNIKKSMTNLPQPKEDGPNKNLTTQEKTDQKQILEMSQQIIEKLNKNNK
jgi:hypothetical protein